jgi:hypothetical protein
VPATTQVFLIPEFRAYNQIAHLKLKIDGD